MVHLQTNDRELLVCGQYLYTGDDRRTVLENAGVVIRGDTIVETGPAPALIARYPHARLLSEERGLVMPGLINCHTHAAMACLRGLADDLPLMRWLQEHIFPVESRLTGEMVYHATLLSLAEMIKSGTTSFCDMYLFAREVARAADTAGMRSWIGEVLYDFPSPCYGEVDDGLRYVEEMLTDYAGHPLVRITVDPHSTYLCSPELLGRLKKIADRHQALYVIHLAESPEEVRDVRDRHGRSPVEHLESLGILDERVVADHCVALTEDDIELLSRRGGKVVHCPESNMKLASGVAPVPELQAAGVTVALGTDGSASNNDVDLFGEMNSCAKLHKIHRLDPTVMPAETVLHMATGEGARALGAAGVTGCLAAGMKADCIVLDLDQPHLTPLYHLPSHLVYAARGGDVIHSIINGRLVMRNRELVTIDEQQVLARMNEMAPEILALRNGS